jgi:D-sedoheptulose 7-phosphate isomerase
MKYMNLSEFIISHLSESIAVKQKVIQSCTESIIQSVEILTNSLKTGHKVLICGNGGSAADAQHIAAEFVIRLSHNLDRPAIPVMALTTDSSILTAGGNDIGFTNVFARQVEAFGKRDDVLFVISTSGNSENIVKAIGQAKSEGMQVVALLGKKGGLVKDIADFSIIVPSENTQHIQESHITIGHIICEAVEKNLYGNF